MRVVGSLVFVIWILGAGLAEAVSLSGTTCPGSGCASFDIDGAGTLGIQITGTFSGTLQFEQTIDTTNWVSFAVVPNGLTSTVTSATGTGLWIGSSAGAVKVRIRFSAYSSGTAVVSVAASQARVLAPGSSGSDAATLTASTSGGFFINWFPDSYTTQNGAFSTRAQPQTNANDPTRRDDTVTLGWNIGCVIPTANSSAISFESYYVTNQGVRQSEMYFSVGDCNGHSQRPIAINYDIDANFSTTLFAGNSYQFTNPAGTVLFAQFSANALLADQFQIQGDGASQTFFKSNGTDNVVDLFLTPKGNGKINLQTSTVGASAALATSSGRFLETITGVTGSCPGGWVITLIDRGIITAATCP